MSEVEPLYVAPRPCNTCPYVVATPPGIWHETEYAKLAEYDDDWHPPMLLFHCHQETATGVPTACKGWLAVHPQAVAVRIGLATGRLTIDQVEAPCPVEVYANGTEAAAAGLAGVEAPSPEATRASAKLLARRVARR